ncbi:MAG: 5-(carboxyamino)imidazole ribonucleotide mutase [Myxococcales bacterium]|nr:5-(carboxyamino)imidazole ribonucleotide mutase [Myxococcales bacterium]
MSRVAVIMGSSSDWETMQHAAQTLERFGVPFEAQVVSAHRTPEWMYEFATTAADEGFACIIAGAGGAAHLPGMVASLTPLPVLGVPVQSKALSGVDSLLSIVQMPAGVPTATFAIGAAGATNAALFAVRLLAVHDPALRVKLLGFREEAAQKARASTKELRAAPTQPPSAKKRKRTKR